MWPARGSLETAAARLLTAETCAIGLELVVDMLQHTKRSDLICTLAA